MNSVILKRTKYDPVLTFSCPHRNLETRKENQSFMSLEDGDAFYIELYSDEEVIHSQMWQAK